MYHKRIDNQSSHRRRRPSGWNGDVVPIRAARQARHDSRRHRRPRFPLIIAVVLAIGFLAPFVVDQVRHLEIPTGAVAGLFKPSPPAASYLIHGSLPICGSGHRVTCLVDGDTGSLDGEKWRLLGTDTPEISKPECANEYSIGIAARNRLQSLMRGGYAIERGGRDRYGRRLVTIRLADGRDVGDVLEAEGLSQPWPNYGNRWCGR